MAEIGPGAEDRAIYDPDDRLMAVVREGDDDKLEVVRFDRGTTPARATAPAQAPAPRGETPFVGPLVRGHLTFTPPWAAGNPLTMELVILAGSTGAECEDCGRGFDNHEGAIPVYRSQVPELLQAGWDHRDSAGLTAAVRFID
jgi:hypothetical protein